jgi:hypothetical protein
MEKKTTIPTTDTNIVIEYQHEMNAGYNNRDSLTFMIFESMLAS